MIKSHRVLPSHKYCLLYHHPSIPMSTVSTNQGLPAKRVRSSITSFSQIQSRTKKQRRQATSEDEANEERQDDVEGDNIHELGETSSTEQWSPCVTQEECIGTLSWITGGVHQHNSLLLITGVIDEETYECVLLRRSDTSTGMVNTQQIFSLPVSRYRSVKAETDDDDDDDEDDDDNTTSTSNNNNRPSAQLSLRSI